MLALAAVITDFLTPRNYKPKREDIFPKANYNPLNGIRAKVDKPTVPLNLKKPSIPLYVGTHLGGARRLNDHLISSPQYRDAWIRRKMGSYYNTGGINEQINKNFTSKIPWQEKKLQFLNGTVISSREPKKARTDTFFGTTTGITLPRY